MTDGRTLIHVVPKPFDNDGFGADFSCIRDRSNQVKTYQYYLSDDDDDFIEADDSSEEDIFAEENDSEEENLFAKDYDSAEYDDFVDGDGFAVDDDYY